jgi:hypothetical protein
MVRAIAGIRERVAVFPGLERQLTLMVDEANGDLDRFRRGIETWYDDTMDRVSGWYRRRAQVALFVIGLVVAGLANAHTFSLVDGLWTDGAVRAALVQQALTVTEENQSAEELREELEARGGVLEGLKQFDLPVGWGPGTEQPRWELAEWDSILWWAAGIATTALALSFGAPFWFDALSKLGRLRVAGKPPSRDERPA